MLNKMKKYKLILLDDEKNVAHGIMKVFDLPAMGFDVAGTYEDPLKLLDEIEKIKPDLVITDIKMPRMNGLEFTEKAKEILTESEIDMLVSLGDGDAVSLGDGQEIDLGGIAKGYTSARVMDIFKECGVDAGLVSLGGNVQSYGTKPDGSDWKVAIRDPEDESNYIGVLKTHDQAVITSGGYERFFEEGGKTYHHIIDPSTGYPAANGIISSTIVSNDGTLADGLSTSLFVMGASAATDYWDKHRDEFDFILETSDHKVYITEGAADKFETDMEVIVVK